MDLLLDEKTPKLFRDWVLNRIESGHTALESVIEWCEDNEVEPESVVQFIDKPLKEKLEKDGIDCKLLDRTKKTNKLDL